MTIPTGNETFLTVTNESVVLPNSRQLTADPFTDNLEFLDGGPAGGYQLVTAGNLKSLTNINSNGFAAYNGTSNTFSSRTLTSDASITITNPDGASANPVLAVNNNTTIQQVNIANGGTTISTRSKLNFINGSFISISVADNGGSDQCDITINSNAGAVAGTWSEYPATQNVNMGGQGITNATSISVGYNSTAVGTYGLNLAATAGPTNACMWMENSVLPSIASATGGVTLSARNNGLVLTNSAANYYVPVTNDSTISTGDLLVGTSAGYFSTLGVGAVGQVLISNGPGVAPSWQTSSASPADWAEFPAVNNVSMNNLSITYASSVSIGYSSATPGTFGLNLAATQSPTGACMWMQSTSSPSTSVIGPDNVVLSANQSYLVVSNSAGNLYPALKLNGFVGQGNILVGNASNSYSDLPIGTSGQVLVSNGTTAQWGSATAAGFYPLNLTIAGGSSSYGGPNVMALVTTTPGDGSNAAYNVALTPSPDGQFLYVQVNGTNSLDIVSNTGIVATISGNAMHYLMSYNGNWHLVY